MYALFYGKGEALWPNVRYNYSNSQGHQLGFENAQKRLCLPYDHGCTETSSFAPLFRAFCSVYTCHSSYYGCLMIIAGPVLPLNIASCDGMQHAHAVGNDTDAVLQQLECVCIHDLQLCILFAST